MKLIGYYNYTVILTDLSLISSVFGIYMAMRGHVAGAVYCLMVSGFCDMFDGKVARTKKRCEAEQKFGIQLDSLSDLVCFGVLPTVIGYAIGMTNKLYVFESKSWEIKLVGKEAAGFIGARLVSLAADMLFMIFAVEYLHMMKLLAKIISNVFVMIINYVFSKLVIFKKK